MRKTSAPDAEVVSQVLFSETIKCLKETETQALVQTEDGYEGWVHSIPFVSHPYQSSIVTSRISVPIYQQKSFQMPPLFNLPFGVGVKEIEVDTDWHTIELPGNEICYIRKGNLRARQRLNRRDLPAFCTQFLGLPYIWGGRSSFGFDCSGFSQMIYRQMGLQLPRDTQPQSQDPRFQDVASPSLGDLIFWGYAENQIRHVAISLGDDQFIHATAQEHMPWLRISSLLDPAWNCKGVYPYRCFKQLKN